MAAVSAHSPTAAETANHSDASASQPATSAQTIERFTQLVHQKPNEHEITILMSDPNLKSLLVIRVRSQNSGDVFEKVIDAAEVAGMTDPSQFNTLEQLLKLLEVCDLVRGSHYFSLVSLKQQLCGAGDGTVASQATVVWCW